MASVPSEISSPAPTPTMPTPRMRSVSGSMIELRQAVGPIERRRAPGRRPRILRDLDRDVLLLRVGLGQTGPGQLGIGEDHGGNRARLEHRRLAVNRFDGDARLVRRLVREHRIAGDVADGEDRRLGRAALPVDFDEAALIHLHLRLVEAGDGRVRTAADRHEHAIEDLRAARRVLPFERDARDPSCRPSRR